MRIMETFRDDESRYLETKLKNNSKKIKSIFETILIYSNRNMDKM